jgi:threonine dehydrogenase-like Zn-dependent dehydrogenase
MQALAVFPQQRQVRIIEGAVPGPLGPHQVLLRVREVGICGTDREIAASRYGEPPPGADHLVLGHEALAEVADVGSEVSELVRGQLVVPTVRRPCGAPRCRPCRAGRQDFCTTGGFRERGIKEAHGFLAELTVEEDDNLVPVPAGLASVGVLVEPLTVVAKGVHQARRLTERLQWEPLFERGLVLGAGPVGLLGAMGLEAHGYHVVVYSREASQSERAAFVRGFGADYVSSEEESLPALAARLGPLSFIFEAAGFSPLAFAALEVLGPNGIAVFSGVPGDGPPTPMNTDRLLRGIVLKNQALHGTVNAGHADYVEAVHVLEALMVRFPDSVRGLISGRFPLEEAPGLLASRRGIKNVVRFGGALA